jgi:hypothetical protein
MTHWRVAIKRHTQLIVESLFQVQLTFFQIWPSAIEKSHGQGRLCAVW